MPGVEQASAPALTGAEPHLFVADVTASCKFFSDVLGFRVVFTYGTPPFFAQVARDSARLNLRHVDRAPIDNGMREDETLLAASLTVASAADIEALCEELWRRGAQFFQPLRTEPWGARTFIVRDPDGNLLHFAGPAA
ncbi:MAG: VOC family protein [Hyphomicrobiales bacterium]|nr:VOC family protein [Hyphomicrobiales bacterium]